MSLKALDPESIDARKKSEARWKKLSKKDKQSEELLAYLVREFGGTIIEPK